MNQKKFKIIKLLFYFLLSYQIVFANEKIETLASTIATPFYNVYNQNVIELFKQHIEKNPDVEAIKIDDSMIDKTAIIYYKNNGSYIYQIDKEFPQSLQLPKRTLSTDIIKDKKTIGVLTLYYNDKSSQVILTKTEKDYLKNKKTITMCVDPNWLPFEKIEDGKHIGLAADFIEIFSQNLNTPIKLIATKSWKESLDFAKNRKCDILSLASKTPSREKFLDFTTPYLDTTIVLATKAQVPFVDNIEQILDKRLGLSVGYSLFEKLPIKYTNINIVKVDSVKDGLAKVASGEIFAYLDNSVVLNYEIQKKYIGHLAISGKLEEHISLGVATRDDEPLLKEIFQKAINSLSDTQKEQIYQKWISIKIEKVEVINYTLVYQTIGFSLLLLAIFAYWNRKITKTNIELELAKKEIEKLAITDKLTNLYNRTKLDQILIAELDRYKRFRHNLTVCLLDIDHFKSVNDTYGHQAGDEVLIQIAQLLKENSRKTDFIGRWGGEEFLIICPESQKYGTLKMVEHLRATIEAKNFPIVGKITSSFGVTELTQNDTIESLIKKADDALYKAKESGRNRVIFI